MWNMALEMSPKMWSVVNPRLPLLATNPPPSFDLSLASECRHHPRHGLTSPAEQSVLIEAKEQSTVSNDLPTFTDYCTLSNFKPANRV
ncbi:hypothetical protein Mapa_006264 [Marchantia paleacea]|nr:hypothetical protein Mapa_006264 [Marchantia paleacea]